MYFVTTQQRTLDRKIENKHFKKQLFWDKILK